jgi:hypothetical protein
VQRIPAALGNIAREEMPHVGDTTCFQDMPMMLARWNMAPELEHGCVGTVQEEDAILSGHIHCPQALGA